MKELYVASGRRREGRRLFVECAIIVLAGWYPLQLFPFVSLPNERLRWVVMSDRASPHERVKCKVLEKQTDEKYWMALQDDLPSKM